MGTSPGSGNRHHNNDVHVNHFHDHHYSCSGDHRDHDGAGMLAWLHGAAPSAARRWSWLLAGLVACQILLGCGAWVVSWGLPSGLLPESWRLSEAIQARSAAGAAVVTGHVVLGMLILGGAVVLWLVGGGLTSPVVARVGRSAAGRTEGVFA